MRCRTIQSNSRFNESQFLTCCSASLFSFYNLYQLSLFNVINNYLRTDFALNNTQLGLFSASYLLANTIWLIPGGILLDRYSVRYLGLIFLAIDVVGCFILGTTTWLPICIIVRFLQGTTSAMSLLICTRLAIQCFPRHGTTALGIMIAFALLGGVFANTIFAKIVVEIGWRHGMLVSGAIGIIFLLFMILFLCDNNTKTDTDNIINWKSIGLVFGNFQNTLHGIAIGLMNMPIYLLASLWGNFYLMHVWKLSYLQASTICALLFVGLIVGGPIVGCISDRIRNPKHLLIWGAILALGSVLPLVANIYLPVMILAVLFFCLGLFSAVPLVNYVMLSKINSKNRMSTAMSYASLLSNLIGSLAQPTFGWLLTTNALSTNHYTQALLILPIAFGFCFMLTHSINNTTYFSQFEAI